MKLPESRRRLPVRAVVALGIAIGLFAGGGTAHAQQGATNPYACGDLRPVGQYGPFDYRTVTSEIRHRVEDYHFTPDVESLRRGSTGAVAGNDLDYTMRAFPNNPRALMSVSRYSILLKTERPAGLRFTAECYFERAIRFVPDDPMPHLLYAIYLRDHHRPGEIRTQLETVERLRGDPSNFDMDYNLALLYFEVGAYDKSMDAAERAYALGAPFPTLKKKLQGVGKWRDPVASRPPDVAPAASDGPATAAVPTNAPADVPAKP